MTFVGEGVAVRQVSDERWELLEDLEYKGRKDTFTVPKGFRTDFASVPQLLTWLIPRYGRYTRAAVLHDHLCVKAKKGQFSRYDADGIFRRSMRELGVGFLRRWLMWIGVRFGSGLMSGFWERGVARALPVLIVGVLCFLLLITPTGVVALWLAGLWAVEWILFPFLKAGARHKPVNRPRGIAGT